MGVVSSESLGVPVSLQVASTNTQASNTQLRRRLPQYLVLYFVNVGATVLLTILNVFFVWMKRKRPEKKLVIKQLVGKKKNRKLASEG